MLIFHSATWPDHRPWCYGTMAFTGAAAIWYGLECCRTRQIPGGSSLPGFVFGVTGGLIVAFESLFSLRKQIRSVRVNPHPTKLWMKALIWLVLFSVPQSVLLFGSPGWSLTLGGALMVAFLMQFGAKHWMRAHIWLGLFSVPLVILHSGFHLSNLTLSSVLMAIFLIVIASGIWGLTLQQKLPTVMLDEVPAEEIHSQIDTRLKHYLNEAQRLVEVTCARGAIPPAETLPLRQFFKQHVAPFLEAKRVDRLQLGRNERSAALFRDLKTRLDPAAHETVTTLEELCCKRRQLAKQARLHNLLHGWLCVHVPLSVALLILLAFHVYVALKYF
jgi:hypothetical protein